jgi:hypothetical protein
MIDLARHAPHFPFLDELVKIKKSERHIALGQAALAHMRANGEELINTPDGPWLRLHGEWARLSARWLAMRIEEAACGFGFSSSTKLINETRNWILRQPELWRDRAPQQDRERLGVQS